MQYNKSLQSTQCRAAPIVAMRPRSAELNSYMRCMKALSAVLLAVSMSAYAEEDCPLKGLWKSNEKMTLESMNKYGSVTQAQRQKLENGFFGKLLIEINCHEFTSTFDGESETVKYELVAVEGSNVTTRYYDSILRRTVESTVVVDGNCYSVPITHLEFREYFCRVK